MDMDLHPISAKLAMSLKPKRGASLQEKPKLVIEGFPFELTEFPSSHDLRHDMMMQQHRNLSRRFSSGAQSLHSSNSYEVTDHHSTRSVHQMQMEDLKYNVSSINGSDARSYCSHQSKQSPSGYSRLSFRNLYDHVAADDGLSVSHSVSSSHRRMDPRSFRNLYDHVAADDGLSVSHSVSSSHRRMDPRSFRNLYDHVAADDGLSVSHSVSSSHRRMELIHQRRMVELELERLELVLERCDLDLELELLNEEEQSCHTRPEEMSRDRHNMMGNHQYSAPDEATFVHTSEYDKGRPTTSSGGRPPLGKNRQTRSKPPSAPESQKEQQASLKLIAELEEESTSSTDTDSLDNSTPPNSPSDSSSPERTPPSPRTTVAVDTGIIQEREGQIQRLKNRLKHLTCVSKLPGKIDCDTDSQVSVISVETAGELIETLNHVHHVDEWKVTVENPSHNRIGWYTGPAKRIGKSGDGKVLPHGDGKIRFSNGDTYSGSFDNGDMHGVAGKYVWSHGDTYNGDFLHNMRHGKGVYVTTNERRYAGYYQFDKPHGFGVLYHKVRRNKFLAGFPCLQFDFCSLRRTLLMIHHAHARHTTTPRQDGTIYHEGKWLNGKPIPAEKKSPGVVECLSKKGAPTLGELIEI